MAGVQEFVARFRDAGLDLIAVTSPAHELDRLDVIGRVLDKKHTKASWGALRHHLFERWLECTAQHPE